MGDLQGFLNSLSVNKDKSGKNKTILTDKSNKAVVSLDWYGDKKVWLLTAYDSRAEAGTRIDTASNEIKDDTARLNPSPTETVNENQDESNSQDEVTRAKEALDANNITGKDRTDTIAQVRAGNLTADDVVESHKPTNQDEGVKAENNPPAFSRGEEVSEPLSIDNIEGIAKSLLAGLARTPKLKVVQNSSELPFDSPTNAVGVMKGGTIYLVADNIASDLKVREAVAHELIGHFGLRGFFGSDLEVVLDEIHKNNNRVREMASKWRIDNKDVIDAWKLKHNMTDADVKYRSIEEALASMAEKGEKLVGIKRLAAVVQKMLRTIGFHEIANSLEAKTDAEALLALKKAEMFVKNGWTISSPIPEAAYPLFMTAYHGSPHDHNKFDMSKVGTGEGNQAYGYGLYFAGSQKVAEWYRNILTKEEKYVNGEVFDPYNPEHYLADILDQENLNIEQAKETLNSLILRGSKDVKSLASSALDLLSKGKKPTTEYIKAKGNLYQVELAPKEDEYLLWDKPLSEQSDTVKNVIKSIIDSKKFPWDSIEKTIIGNSLYFKLRDELGSDKDASEYLHSIGIRGIKYLDGSSRNQNIEQVEAKIRVAEKRIAKAKESGDKAMLDTWTANLDEAKKELSNFDFNYVIFNDEDVSITAKYSKSKERTPFIAQDYEGYIPALNKLIGLFKTGDRNKQQEAGNTPVPISRTPVVLRQVIEDDGSKPFRNSDFVVGIGSTLYLKADNIHSRSIHTGRISKEVLDRLPQLLADPIAVFKSSSSGMDTKSFKVLVDAVDENGNPVIVAIKPSTAMQQLNGALVNLQATIFPATWDDVNRWNKSGDLRYYNEKSPLSSVAASNPLEAAANADAKEGFNANIGVSTSKVKVINRSEIESLPQAAYSKGNKFEPLLDTIKDSTSSKDKIAVAKLNNIIEKQDGIKGAFKAIEFNDGGLGKALQKISNRVSVHYVVPTNQEANNIHGIQVGNDLYINPYNGQNGFIQLAGHELLHHIRGLSEEHYQALLVQAKTIGIETESYKRRLESNGIKLSDSSTEEELLSDFLGDALADPEFLQALADDNPSTFKKILDVVIKWLDNVSSILSKEGFGSSEYIKDVNDLRGYLWDVLDQFSKDETINPVKQTDSSNIRYSKSNPTNESAPEETTAQASERVIQDKFNRFKVLQNWLVEKGVQLSEAADVYLAETLMSGRVATRKED